jgi:penicillin-binding protein 2
VEGFRIGGKTGTAQNPHGEDHALYVAVAPMDEPRYVVVVVAEESGHGGAVAAPVAQPILQHLLTGSPEPEMAARAAGEERSQ